jgi:hypothetical protein
MQHLQKTQGVVVLLWLTRNPIRIPVLRSIAMKDLSTHPTKGVCPERRAPSASPDPVGTIEREDLSWNFGVRRFTLSLEGLACPGLGRAAAFPPALSKIPSASDE